MIPDDLSTTETTVPPVNSLEVDRKKFISDLLTRIVILLAMTAVIGTVILQAVVLNKINNQVAASIAQSQNNEQLIEQVTRVSEQTKAIVHRNRQCSTPGKRCYEEQQSNITDLVEDINKITLLTAVCVDENQPDPSALEIRACVVKKIAHETNGTPHP